MADPPPKPPPTLLANFLAVDTKFSLYLHTMFHRFLPTSFLLLLELSADFRFSFPLSLALYFSPLSPSILLPFLSSLVFGLLLDLALVGLVKILFRRPRPSYNPSMSPAVSADHFSFPSGHASRVFLLASLVYLSSDFIQAALLEIKSNGWWWDALGDEVGNVVVLVVCAWAATTAASRVLLGRHFLVDVLVGACLGILEGALAFRFLRFEELLSTTLYSKIAQAEVE